jgi:hypothetical protein
VIIVPSLSDDDARAIYPKGWKQVLPYMRVVPQPGTQEDEVAVSPAAQPAS